MRSPRPHGRLAPPAGLLLVGLLACAPPATPAPSPAPAAPEGAHPSHAPAPGLTGAAADVRFLQHMIPHHAQALVMTALVPARTTRTDIRLIAERIAVSQRDEIAQMQRWLESRGAEVPGVDTAHALHAPSAHAGMPGMLTTAQLQRLAASRSPAFDRLFLESMIEHHRGAIVMVAEVLAAGGAQDSELFGIASEVESDQLMEIARMERLLATLPPAPSAP